METSITKTPLKMNCGQSADFVGVQRQGHSCCPLQPTSAGLE